MINLEHFIQRIQTIKIIMKVDNQNLTELLAPEQTTTSNGYADINFQIKILFL